MMTISSPDIALIPAWIDGQLTEVDKLEVHHKGLKHKAVSVFLMAGDKTLIQQRAAGKYHSPLLWANACCTHPAMGETAVDCATRRLQQELGITGVSPEPLTQIEYRAAVGKSMVEHEVVEVLKAEVSENLFMQCNPEEVAATEWVTLAALKVRAQQQPDLFTAWLKIYLEKFVSLLE